MQTIIGEDQIQTNEQLYGNCTVEDAALINSDPNLTPEQRTAAIMDPEGYKFNLKNPYIVKDAMNYPALFENLRNPSKYKISSAFQEELQAYEDELKNHSRTLGAFENTWREFRYTQEMMDLDDLYSEKMDAIKDEDQAKLAKIEKEIAEQELHISRMTAPSRQSWGAIGSLTASIGREIVPLAVTSIATGVLAAATPASGGTTAAGAAVTAGKVAQILAKIKKGYDIYRSSKFAVGAAKVAAPMRNIINASIIYNDTANVERGSAYKELKTKYPEMSEEEAQQKAWMIGRINGGFESATAFLGTAAIGGRAMTGIARRSILKRTLSGAVAKSAISEEEKAIAKRALTDLVDKGVVTPEMINNSGFFNKMISKVKALAETRTFQAAEFGADVAMEGATEVYQDEVQKTITELKQGETMGYGEVLQSAQNDISSQIQEVYDYLVSGKEMSEAAKQNFETFKNVAIGSALIGGGFKAIDYTTAKMFGKEARGVGNQIDTANRTIGTFDTILAQKKNSKLYGTSPETISEFYKNAKNQNELPESVYTEVDRLNLIIEEMKNDPVATAKLNALKLAGKIKDAEDTDGLVEIPTEDFIDIVVDPKNDTLYQRIKGDITSNPAMNSKNGSIKLIEQMTTADQMMREAVEDPNSIYNKILEQQTKAGTDENLAKVNAIITQAMFNTFQRMRTDGAAMQEIMNQIALRVENVDKIDEQAGALNMFVGPKAVSPVVSRLVEAQRLYNSNEPVYKILEKTGWFLDIKDNKWKFEISDKDASLNLENLRLLFNNKFKNAKLSDILNHEKLYELYPELADLNVIYNSHLRKTSGQQSGKNIELKKTNNFEDLLSTVLHEVQHRVQDLEGFGKGGQPKGQSRNVPEHLRDSWIERNRLNTYLWDYIRSHGVKTKPDVDSGGHPVAEWAIKDVHSAIEKLAEKDPELKAKLKRHDELSARLKTVDEGNRELKYQNLSGENEARDTQNRQNLTEEERRSVLPAGLTGERAPVVTFKIGDEVTEIPTTGTETAPVEQILGQITFGAETLIRLASISNPTTFAHEMFHLFGRQLFGNYNAGILTERWQKHTDTLAEFLGIEKDENGQYQFAGNTEAEEKLAEAGTSYLKTGKAPAPYLKELFDTIAEWFANIYNMLKMSAIPLDKKVTRVFDEIFVPYEKQVAIIRERRYGFIPKPENMTDEQYEKYVAEKRAAAMRGTTEEVKRATKLQEIMSNDVYKEEYEASYREAYDDLGEVPVYQLIDDVLKLKINKESLKKIPQSIVLPRKYISKTEGLDITQLSAEYTNLAKTPEELAQLLSDTPDRETAARYIAEKHMQEWLQENYPEVAEIDSELASRNERVFKLAVMEYMMLSGIGMERFNQIHNDLMAAAEYMVQNMPLQKIVNVQRWIEQENKLLQRYDYTLSTKEKSKIKRQQAVLNYYAMRSKQLRAEAHKFLKKSHKYRGSQTADVLKKIDGETFDLLKSILSRFKITTAKPNTNIPLSLRIDNWINSMASDGYTGADEIARYRDGLIKGVEEKLTTKDFEFLQEAFGFIEAVGRNQKMVNVHGVLMSVEQVAQSVLDSYIKHGTKPLDKELGSAVMREAVLRAILPEQVFVDYVAPFFEGLTKKDLQIQKWRDQLSAIIKPLYKRMQEKVEIDGHVYTNENLLVMMLNSGNKHNINCIVKTLQYQFNDPEYGIEALFSALNQAPKEMREMTRKIWKIFDDNKPAFQAAQRKIDGKVLKFVEPESYSFEDGEEMPGGYYPTGKVSVINDYQKDSTKFTNSETYATKSFQRDRTGAHGDLDLTLGTMTAWFYKMAGVLHVAVPYNNLGKLLKNETFKRTVGEGMIKSLDEWRKLSVTPDRVNQILSAVNQVASVSILGLAPVKMFTQMSGVIPAMAEIGPYWVMQGIATTNPINAIHNASKLSPYMLARYEHPSDHLHLYTQSQNMLGENLINVGKDAADKLSTGAMFFIIYGDAIASTVTWKAEFAKQKSAGMTDKQASDLADSAVRRLQGDASAGSRAPIIQGNMRFFTMFASYFIGLHSLMVAHKMKGDEKMKAIGLLFAAAVAAPVFEAVFKSAWKMATADDDDKEKMSKEGIEDGLDLFLKESLQNILSTAGAIWIPQFGLGGYLGSAIATGKTYAPENLQLKYMMKPIEFGARMTQAMSAMFNDDSEKAGKELKKGLKSIFEFSMINPGVAGKLSEIITGD